MASMLQDGPGGRRGHFNSPHSSFTNNTSASRAKDVKSITYDGNSLAVSNSYTVALRLIFENL